MYSIVIPCYKSSATIETVVRTTADEMRRMGRSDFEFVLVNDGSPDGGKTIAKLRELVAVLPYVRAVDLARNSGQHNATMAGLRTAAGDVFICMDDDLQTRPSELHKMFAAFDEGYDMVYGVYPQKKESAFRLFGSWFNSMSGQLFLGKPKGMRTTSFWIMRKYVRDSVIAYDGAHTYLTGLVLRSTSPEHIAQVEVEHFEREVGSSGYTLKALIGLWSNMIGFTVKPLRTAMQFGSFICLLSLVGVLYVLISKLTNPNLEAGWASIMLGIFFSLGVQLFFIGMIGEYVGRSYMSLNREPQYVVREILTHDASAASSDTPSGKEPSASSDRYHD